jgi:hypothetical protein
VRYALIIDPWAAPCVIDINSNSKTIPSSKKINIKIKSIVLSYPNRASIGKKI